MKNVVITGMGIKSCIGNNYKDVLNNLQNGRSGIVFNKTYSEMGFRSCVSGTVNIELSDYIDRKLLRFMGESAGYAYLATKDALEMAGIDDNDLDSPKIGIVAGSGGASTRIMVESGDIARKKGPKRIGPYGVTKSMSSSISAIIATALKLKGVNYSISSACATSAHCIGHAADLIKNGSQDIVIAGGSDDEHWSSSCLFDAMGALSSKYNKYPEKASRPYDLERDGVVISGGAGYDMVAPSGEGAKRCMQGALDISNNKIDYINTHGTSTPVGDVAELNAIKELFKTESPLISSTKSMTGHSLGATGAHEAIYSIMMLNESFIAPSINIESLCDEAKGLNIVSETKEVDINNILSNSFGFGGTNASLVLSKF